MAADPPSIIEAIDAVLATRAGTVRREKTNSDVRLRQAKDVDGWNAARTYILANGGGDSAGSSSFQAVPSLIYGFLLLDETTSDEALCCGLVTFNMAYSTWNGRFMLVDKLECADMDDAMEIALLKALAKIGCTIGCVRLTWRHKTTPKWHVSAKLKPELMDGWLTLRMGQAAVADYAFQIPKEKLGETDDSFSRSSVERIITNCLSSVNELASPDNKYGITLRLASENDISIIARLVQGLAVYEKEPHAVKMNSEGYRKDGYSSDNPFFYCILLDKNDDDGSVYTFGMAFIFFGYYMSEGYYMYLEDLFLEEQYRKMGGGSLAMKSLATFGQALGCAQLYWQALDWNEPALNFYNKIGAQVLDGLLTSRFTGRKLQDMAKE